MKNVIIVAVLLLTAGSAFAAGREARPVACLEYTMAKLPSGGAVAICEGGTGRASVLTRFTEASVTGEDGRAVKVLVGFR